jgi:nucleoside-diphosphate-sugar epimerase
MNNTSAFYSQPYDVIENSILPQHNILKRYKGTPIIYTSSSETYAGGFNLNIVPIPTPEDVPLIIDDITNPRWSYSASKILGESMIVAAHTQFGTPYKIIRYHNIYGPGQKNHFIPEFIDRCLNNEYILHGADATRSFCYIDDAIKATLTVANIMDWDKIINIGSNDEWVIQDVAKEILNQLNIKTDMTVYDSPVGSVARRQPDITKLKELGWSQTIPLPFGILKILKKDYNIG